MYGESTGNLLGFVPQLIMSTSYVFFFFFWPHAKNLGFGHVLETDIQV